MYTCDACSEEFETLSELRIEHEPCAVAEAQRRYEAARERLAEERGLAIGDRCRLIASGEEVEIVDVDPAEDDAPDVVCVPAGEADASENRRTVSFDDIV